MNRAQVVEFFAGMKAKDKEKREQIARKFGVFLNAVKAFQFEEGGSK